MKSKFNKIPIDLTELSALLKKEKIKHKLRIHPLVKKEPEVKKLIGYYPGGKYQIIIQKPYLSIIRGMVSWGDYELFNGNEIKRTKTAEQMVEAIKQYNPLKET